ncbi:MAG: beta-N-acetylhexosaminidase [Bdellovibrionales bacterium]|nr:beta-N-acetylhexosaminidase [Bdellovibrionales bacterium]
MSVLSEAMSRLGECILTGFSGTTLADDTAAFLSQAGLGGVILFKDNYADPEQLAELIRQVQECRGDLPFWVSVDQEGGRVQRFGAPFTRLPPAAAVGATNSPQIAFEIARICAVELKTVGVNVNFAPVCDILTNPANPVIGDRAYGTDEDRVSRIITAVVRGMLMGGVQPCMKHFPGHGDTDKDSHFDLPKVTTPMSTLRERELKPFVRGSKSRCAMLMTAHILVPELDRERPATLSPFALRKLLREELRYSRVIFSDDMEMKAVTDHFGDEAPVMAMQAGCDALLYRSEAASRHAYELLVKALEDGRLQAAEVLQSAERLRSLKATTLLPHAPTVPGAWKEILGCPAHLEAVARVAPSTKALTT